MLTVPTSKKTIALVLLLFASSTFAAIAATDLEVTYIERTPKYKSYQGAVLYAGDAFTDDWINYYATYAYGTSYPLPAQHWPEQDETVTWIAHVYNRGTTTISSFDYEWTVDGSSVDSGTYTTPIPAGGFATFSIPWTWVFEEHEIEFSTTVTGDSHPSNDSLMVYSNSLGLFTFIDYGFAATFTADSASYPNATTDSIAEWLQNHCTRMNDMFIEAGCDLRWRYDLLEFLEDGGPMPSVDSTQYDGSFPQRYYYTDGDPRSPGYYHEDEDIDYGLLHEIGHQLGIIDIYQMDVPGTANEVNGQGYFACPGLMHGVSDFISEHTALAMNAWHGKRRGFFGQYLYDIPTTNNVRVMSIEGIPVPDVTVTVYEYVQMVPGGKKIPNTPKFSGMTGSEGTYTLPNVSLSRKNDFWSDTGNSLEDNPFGYVWCIGNNCVFLVRLEKDGITCYDWLDITKFNIAYWKGNTDEATYNLSSTFHMAPYFTGGLELSVLDKPYHGALEIMKGTPPYTVSLLGGSLPPGISMNPDGSFSGVPTQRGEFPLLIEVTDSSVPAFAAQQNVTLQVIDPELWQMHQNTKRRIGTSVISGPSEFSTLWSTTNGSVGRMAPAIEGGDSYYGASWPSNTVWKISENGTKLWEANDNAGGHLNGTPAIGIEGESASSVYIGPSFVLDVSKSNGVTNWKTSAEYKGDLAIGNGSKVYSHRWNNSMYGLQDNGSSSSIVFTGALNADCRCSATLFDTYEYGEVMVWGGRNGTIYAVKTNDWSYLWTLQMAGTRIDVAPCVDSLNHLYFATALYDKEYFFAIDGLSGDLLWENATERDSIWASGSGALSVDQKTYYIQTQGNAVPLVEATNQLGQLFAINTSDGTTKWTYNTRNYGWDMPGMACTADKEGKVYVSANTTTYCVKDMDTHGELVWEIELGDNPPMSFSIDRRGALMVGTVIDGYSGLHAIYGGLVPEEPVVFRMRKDSSGYAELTWESQFGATYRVERAESSSGYVPGSLTWTTVAGNVVSEGISTTWSDSSVPAGSSVFYRVVTKNP